MVFVYWIAVSIGIKLKLTNKLINVVRVLAVACLCANAAVGVSSTKPSADLTLYTITVPAVTQQTKEREQLIQQAFQKVLLRLTSSAVFLKTPAVQQALKQVDPFVSQFTFEGFGENSTQEKALKVVFNSVALNQFLKKLGRPIWNEHRQNTLVWVGLEREDKRFWVTPDSAPEIWTGVAQAFQDRAVPMVFPLFDLLDETEFPIKKIWENQFERVLPTLKRYGAQLCVLGLMREHPGGWHAEWFLFSDTKIEPLKQWQVTDLDIEPFLQNSLEDLGTFLAKTDLKTAASSEVSVVPEQMLGAAALSDQEDIQVAIAGIQNSVQYAKVLSYLKRITNTETQIDILGIEPEYTLFRLRPAVSLDILRRKVQQDALLFERYDAVAKNNPLILYLDLVEVDRL
jgi:hypothetical protein